MSQSILVQRLQATDLLLQQVKARENALRVAALPWWANGDPKVAEDSYHQGYYARIALHPRDETMDPDWLDGWDTCEADTREGVFGEEERTNLLLQML